VLLDILEELDGALEFPSIDCLGGFAGIFEGNSKVGTASAGRLRRMDLSCCVSDLNVREFVSSRSIVYWGNSQSKQS
jgi:hypothetical protein